MRWFTNLFFILGLFAQIGHASAADQGAAVPATISPAQTALIILHGKWGKPPAPLAERFTQEGFHVISPEMPWSGGRLYNSTYEEALKALHETIAELRVKGFRKILIGGQSFGANGALAYASVYGDVDGIFMMAPGHHPELGKQRQGTRLIADAKEMVAKGKSDALVDLIYYNDGNRSKGLQISAKAYLSFYDENSLANMSRSAATVKKPVPVLIIMGHGDYITGQGKGYIFGRLPAHPLSLYIESDAPHREVPKASFPAILKWVTTITSS